MLQCIIAATIKSTNKGLFVKDLNAISWNDVLSFTHDIGMFSFNLPVSTCKHHTAFCRTNCYNNKLYGTYGKSLARRDVYNQHAWDNLPLNGFFKVLARKREQTKRIRLANRGEFFSSLQDFAKVETLLDYATRYGVAVWIPTRAWRNAEYLERLVKIKRKYRNNARILCSTDPSNFVNDGDMRLLDIAVNVYGFSTMFFGDNALRSFTVGGKGHSFLLCPKTHAYIKGACATCKGGCFNSRQKHIHLKKH